jgi:hypothetical protein
MSETDIICHRLADHRQVRDYIYTVRVLTFSVPYYIYCSIISSRNSVQLIISKSSFKYYIKVYRL